MQKNTSFRAALVMTAACFAISAHAVADPAKKFDIPPGDLASALDALARQSGVELMYSSSQVKGLQTAGVQGEYTAEGAANQLLSGTKLELRIHESGALLIAKANPRTSSVRSHEKSADMFSAGASYAEARQSASTGAQQSVELETIIVTSERLGRSVMNTSTSVVVRTEADLRSGIDGGTNDILASIPNITATGTGNFAPAVRGIDGTGPASGADAFVAGTRSRLNIQLDGRPATYNEIVFGDAGVWDVEQIEVLRGAQSTLQGRNAIAGTLAIRTRSPTYTPEARFRVAGGNMKSRQYSAAVSAPLIEEQLAFRLSADRAERESFVNLTPYPGMGDPRDMVNSTYNAKLLMEPKAIEGLKALLTVKRADSISTQLEWVERPYDSRLDGARGSESHFQPRTTAGVLDLSYDISDGLELQTLLAYTDLNVRRFANPGNGNADIDARERVAETLLHVDVLEGRLHGLVGLYYFDAESDEVMDFAGGGQFREDSRTIAVFSEGTMALSDKVDLTLGARYEEEHRKRDGALAFFLVDLDETYKTFLPKAVLSWHPTEQLTLGALVARGYNGGSAGITFFAPFIVYTFKPEYVWNHEAFVRAKVSDRIEVRGNLFFSDYEDMQLPFAVDAFNVVIRNADQVETYGAELEVTALVATGLKLSAGLGLLATDIKSYPGSGVEGDDLARAPHVTGNLSASYRHHGGLELGVDARYSASYYSDQSRNPALQTNRTDPFWLVNATAGYTFGRVRAFSYVTNLFDSQKPLLLVRTVDSAYQDYTGAQIPRPRAYGIGLEVEF